MGNPYLSAAVCKWPGAALFVAPHSRSDQDPEKDYQHKQIGEEGVRVHQSRTPGVVTDFPKGKIYRPTVPITATAPTAISAVIRPYSIAVAPYSLLNKSTNTLNIKHLSLAADPLIHKVKLLLKF